MMGGLRISALWKPAGCKNYKQSQASAPPSAETDFWEEVEAQNVATFERAGNNLHTPKWLRLGPLFVAPVESAPPITEDFLELQGLNPS
jgi:hypothetical protein